MEEFCRICLGIAPRIHSVHISYKIALNKTVSQVVHECASIQLSEQDSFPKFLCSKCYQQLLVVNEFRELIIKSDIHLKEKESNITQLCDETNSVDSYNADNQLTPDITESVIKPDSNHSQIKEEDQTCLGSTWDISNNKATQRNVFAIAQDLCDDETELLELNERRESEKSAIEKLIVDCQDTLLSDLEEESQIKTEHIIRTNPGRKPSKMSNNKRKVHEFSCPICKKVLFGRSNRLEQHIIMAHSNIKNYVCETCNKKFKSKQQLVNHTRVHTGEKPYECDICKETFASPQNLFNHKKKHTGQHKSYKCESCQKGYSTPGELETHKRIVHTGEKPFLCEICSGAYSSARNLGLHIRSVHEKTEKCLKCGLMLSNKRIKQHLQKHQDKEDGIRRYTCDKCGKGFFTPHALKKHLVVHTGEKPYSCEVCHRFFSQKSAVDTHMRTHSDVRGFCCELCAKTFKYKQHLQLHLTKIHREHEHNKMLAVDDDAFEESVKAEAPR